MKFRVDTVTLPAYWASALINGDYSSFSLNDDGGAAEIADLKREVAALAAEGWQIVDVARDEDGNVRDPRFTWQFSLYGGNCAGGDVLDYVIHNHREIEGEMS